MKSNPNLPIDPSKLSNPSDSSILNNPSNPIAVSGVHSVASIPRKHHHPQAGYSG